MSSKAGRNWAGVARHGRGFTLPELLLVIVVLGVGLAGILLAFQTVGRGSADAVLQRQMQALAEELIEEIQLRPYAVAANAAPAGCARDSFNDVRDYQGYASSQACTIDGAPIPALAGYAVAVQVEAGTLAGVPGLRIAVSISHDGQTYTLVGWRTDYAS